MAEKWRKIPGFDGYYEISNFGNVRSYKNGRWGKRKDPKLLSPNKNTKGYLYVILSDGSKKHTKRIHRLVAESFCNNDYNKPCVNHIDGNPLNNHVDNLEWVTYSENSKHAYDNGLTPAPPINNNRGVKQGSSKLCKNDVLDIRNIWNIGCFTQTEISNAFGIHQSHVSDIINRKRWAHI